MVNEINDLNEVLVQYANKENASIRNSKILVNGNILYTSIVGKIEDENVYGVSSKMNIKKIKEELIYIEDSPLESKEKFDNYLDNNREMWKWKDAILEKIGNIFSDSVEDLNKGILGKCLISVVNQFSVGIVVENNILDKVVDLLNTEKIYYQIIEEKNKNIVKIHGRLTKKQESKLEEHYIVLKIEEELKLIIKNSISEIQGTRVEFKDLYKNLKCSQYLYSGVITNIDEIEFMPENEANISLSQIKVKISKTTFATVLGIGHPQLSNDEGKLYKKYYLKEHELLSKYLELLNEFDRLEEEAQKVLFENFKQEGNNFLKEVNTYLGNSFYPHIISIAGNVITSDDYNLYLSRGVDVEQENLYSCSVTGYSEINDDDIEFYKYSVEDDRPSINGNKGIINFNGEFVRETRAELGVSTEMGEWRTYGIIVSGKSKNIKRNNNQEVLQPLTVDFEVAAQVDTRNSLNEIIDKQKDAIESGEASNIYGLKINMYENKAKLIKSGLVSFLEGISRSKDLIIIAFLLSLNVRDVILEKKSIFDIIQGITTDIMGVITFSINIILVILFIVDLIKIINDNKNKNNIKINKNKFSIDKLNRDISKKIDSNNSSYLLMSMMSLYVIGIKNKFK